MTFRWPQGTRAAAAFTFDLDAESGLLFGAAHLATHAGTMSHQAYGPLTGLPRLLALLERRGIRSTFCVPGFTAERYPDAVRSIRDGGHEIAHHGYLHEEPASLTLAQEIEALDRGLAALDAIAGVRPVGYRAPMWNPSWHTGRLLAERGFLYDSSFMDADLPYEMATAAGPLVQIPVQWALDDWEQYCFVPEFSGSGLIETPAKATGMWRAEFHAMHAEGLCWVLTNHPFLSGRPSRAAALGQLMEHVQSHEDVWVTTLGEIAAHTRSLGLEPRTLPADPRG